MIMQDMQIVIFATPSSPEALADQTLVKRCQNAGHTPVERWSFDAAGLVFARSSRPRKPAASSGQRRARGGDGDV
jgi:hypothetical protein